MHIPVCYLLVCDNFLATQRRRVPAQTTENSCQRPRHYLALTIHFFVLGIIFLILAAILLGLELASATTLRVGYWNGALAAISALAMFCVAAYPMHWTMVFLLMANSFNLLACTIVALATAHEGREQTTSYWICLAILTLSVYSMFFVLIRHGIPWTGAGDIESDFIFPSMEQSTMQEPQPPEGFLFPGEERLPPDYDSLPHPPKYCEATGECNSEGHTTAGKNKNKPRDK